MIPAGYREPRIAAIRTDPVVGNGSCSVVDECWTDGEILEALDDSGLRTVKGALSWAREVHQNFLEREKDCQYE